jgi:hypothetical protein
MFVPYSFRPFWQPNSRASWEKTQDFTEGERFAQKLDAAEKKINEYARLSGFIAFCHLCLLTIDSCVALY